jgi:pimeloyl-ACP methyl ester carboxylesterase
LLAGLLGGGGGDVEAQTNLRGWHAAGQTWLVWTDDRTFQGHETYDVYVSDQPISDLAAATLLGRTFPDDWRATRLKLADPDATWVVPDGSGGTYTLAGDEALFVHTPHEAEARHFAVVKGGDTVVGPQNSTGPIDQGLDPVTCHAQLSGTTELGYEYTVWASWVDGREDHTDRRADIEVMGNRWSHGTAHLMAVYEPLGGRPPGLLPAVLQLHGGGGRFTNWRPEQVSNIDNDVPGGFVVALDSNLHVARQLFGIRYVEAFNPWWFGHWEGYDRFAVPGGPPPDESLVVDYSLRRVGFLIEWLREEYPVDPQRVSVLGHSMGAGGSTFLARRFPDRIAAAIPFEHAHSGQLGFVENLIGTREQNLPTTLLGGVRMTDFYKPATTLPGLPDPGPTTYVWGKNDTVLVWQLDEENHVPARMAELDEARLGAVIDWDQRNHTRGEWEGQWVLSPRHGAEALSRIRLEDSFPAISDDDYDPAPGRQRDPGNGDPEDGDPWGTWGGWVDWERDTVEDAEQAWAVTLFLVGESSFPADVAPVDEAPLHVTVRRASAFTPPVGTELFWTLRGAATEELRQSGPLAVPEDGLVTVEGLRVSRDPDRVRLRVTYAADDDGDGRDAQVDCDDGLTGVWATPGEVRDLRWGADGVTLSWIPPEEPGGEAGTVAYDTLRSTDPADFAGEGVCVESGDGSDTEATDVEEPQAGASFSYLVRALNACPDGVGTAGQSSAGLERDARACP